MIRSVRLFGLCTSGIVMAAALVGGCSSAEPDGVSVQPAQTNLTIFGGTKSTTHNEVANLQFQVGITVDTGGAEIVAPTLAVSALRAVVKGFSEGNSESLLASGTVCATVGATYDPSQITLNLGDNPQTVRHVVRVITNGQSNTCQGGIAFLILDQPITTISFPQLQLDEPPAANDAVTGCGFGDLDTSCTTALSPYCMPGNVIIGGAAGGYYAADQDTFPAGFVLTSVNMCGDADRGSGLYDKNGALIAINDKYYNPDKTKVPTIQEPCAECAGAVTGAILLSGQKDFVASAFAAIGSSPWRVGHPKPADVGATCTDNLDCNSQLCVQVGGASYCSQSCDTTACPASTVCTTIDSRSVCLPQVTPKPASCSVTGAPMGETPKQEGREFWRLALVVGILAAGGKSLRSRSLRKNRT